MGAQIGFIKFAVQLFNTKYQIGSKDLIKINWDEWNRKTQQIVNILGDDPSNYTLESLILDAQENLITGKIFVALFPYLECLLYFI